MRTRSFLTVLALLAAAFASADPHNWHLSTTYTYDLDQDWKDAGVVVTNIIAFSEGGSVDGSYGWGSTSWAFTSDQKSIEQTFDTAWFNVEAAEPTLTQGLMMGLVHDLPNDASGQEHVVLFMNADSATYVDHIAWGTLFRNTLEENIIDAIHLATSGQDGDTIKPGFDAISDFTHGDGETGILDNLAQPHSIWIEPNRAFSIVSFSDGAIHGSGTNVVTTSMSPVPEPASFAALGVGAAALLRRRRKF